MVRTNGACPCPPVPPQPVPPQPTPVGPVVGVTSVNGKTGAVVLENLIFGDKKYNGSAEVEIKGEDILQVLGLENTDHIMVFKGAVTEYAKLPTDPTQGDVYFCTADSAFYMCYDNDPEIIWKALGTSANIQALTEAEIKAICI